MIENYHLSSKFYLRRYLMILKLLDLPNIAYQFGDIELFVAKYAK